MYMVKGPINKSPGVWSESCQHEISSNQKKNSVNDDTEFLTWIVVFYSGSTKQWNQYSKRDNTDIFDVGKFLQNIQDVVSKTFWAQAEGNAGESPPIWKYTSYVVTDFFRLHRALCSKRVQVIL